jgi:hypothetical protein
MMMKRLLLFIFISSVVLAKPYRGGELRTFESFRYGRFEVRMKSAIGSGVVSSFFTFRDYWEEGLTGSEHWNEIDLEWLGNYNDKTQTNLIIQNGWDLPDLVNLDFNPHEDFHTYAIEWTPDYVAFFADEQVIRWVDNFYADSLYHYQKIMMNMWQPIYEEWVGPFNPDILPVYAFYDWVKYCAYVPGTGNTGTDNNFIQLWEDQFDYWDTGRWGKATHTFDGNNVDFIHENVVFHNGYMILCLTTPDDTGFNEGSINMNLSTGWNIIGLPLEVENSNYEVLFPNAVAGTLYGFNGFYTSEMELEPGTGYWLNFQEADTASLTGSPLTSFMVSLTEGWNLISGNSAITNVGNISDPGNIIVPGTCYGFNETYINADQLIPGNGYWIYASADGNIIILSNLTAKPISTFTDRTEIANKISFNNSELYFGVSIPEEERNSYKLPPKPPLGAFDARFSGDTKLVETFGNIEVMNNTQELFISYSININEYDDKSWLLISSENEEYELEDSGQLILNGSVGHFTLSRVSLIPTSFSISQNFPNPFNPITSINYIVPENSAIAISIYNLSGQKIIDLVDSYIQTGVYTVTWDGMNHKGLPVPSGVYIYTFETNSFKSMKKMILIK